jgi:chitodextrinase
MASSPDGLSWTGSTVIANATTEQFYPTVLGEDGNPNMTGQQFYVYYTSSVTGGFNRWTDAVLARRLVSLSGTLDFSPSITSAAAVSSNSPSVGQSVSFAVAASDPNLSALIYAWTFGDGTTASGSSVSHAYNTVGNYIATVTVTNGQGESVSSSVPLSCIQGSGETFAGWETSYSFSGAASDTPYNDSVPNLMKYLFDIDPTKSLGSGDRSALPHVGALTIAGTSYLTMTYRENPHCSGISVSVETSSDLVNWTLVANPTVSQVGTDAATGDPIVQARVPSAGTTEFIRLAVTP